MTATSLAVRRATPVKAAAASFIGTAIEWYDYFVHGMAAAAAFGPLFFPSSRR